MVGCRPRIASAVALLTAWTLALAEPDSGLDALLAEDANQDPASTGEADASAPAAITLPQARPPAVSPKPPARQIEEILVTAQKTAQSLTEVPISITALQGDFLRERGARNLQDIAAFIPNVRFSSDTDPALAQVNVRGFGSNPLNAAFESSVAFVQDDLYFARPGYFSEAIFDVERVEVLRGPQGTLFGKNSVAGVFNVYSRGPTAEWAGDLRASLADPMEHRLEAGLGGPLTERLGLRLALLEFDRKGGLENTQQPENADRFEQAAQRLKLHWLASQSISLDATLVSSDTRSAYWPLQLNRLDSDTTEFLQRYDPQIEGSIQDYRLSHDTPGFLDKGSDTASLSTQWALGNALGLDSLDATLVLGVSDLYIDSLVDLDASPAHIADLTVVSDHDQRSAELRLAGRQQRGLFGVGESFEFVAGAYAFTGRFIQHTEIAVGEHFGDYVASEDAAVLASGGQIGSGFGALIGPLTAVVPVGTAISTVVGDDRVLLDYLLKSRSIALFGQATWYLTERFALTPGLRYTRERKLADAAGSSECRSQEAGCVLGLALSASDYDAQGLKRVESDLSPKLSLQYFAGEDIGVFLTWASGFKSGGFNGSSFDGADLEFEDEKARTLELGVKSFWLNRSLSLNATVFETRLDDLQVLAFNGAFFDVTNAASARSRGLELDFSWLTPWPMLKLAGSLGLLDAKYRRYPDAPAPVAEGGDATQDLGGKPIALAPEQTVSLTPTLTLPAFGLGLQLAVDFLYQGDQYSDTDLDPASFIDGNLLIQARLSLGAADQRWALTLAGSNITNEKLFTQNIDTVFFPGSFNGIQKAERQLLLAFTLSY